MITPILFILFASFSLYGVSQPMSEAPTELKMEQHTPQYLYKILSLENWELSQNQKSIHLSSDDMEFIHFSTHDQLDRIIHKYWKHEKKFVILKIESSKLLGKLVFESNPGGSNKYFHLYHGSIPVTSVVNVQIVDRASKK